MTAALRTSGLAIGYRARRTGRVVLEHLHLSVAAGDLVCLLGPNGTGKSTLLRTLSKIQPALAGSVEIGGIDLRRLSETDLAQRLGVVLTERVSIGSLSAERIVELGRYPHLGWSGTLGARDHEVVRWALAALGAERLAPRDSATLSDGERQRIMIARALAQEPLVLLLDEPTAFLDVPSRVELMGLLRHLARDEHLAIVVSTHDLELALRTADTIWLIEPGGRLHAGAPEDIVFNDRVTDAFRGDAIRFHPWERAFRPVGGGRGSAAVHGEGLAAFLARAVLEREGYDLSAERTAGVLVTILSAEGRWRATAERRAAEGDTFAALAAFVRHTSESRAVRDEEAVMANPR
jgi:iron complex transport system ATP-binding protein